MPTCSNLSVPCRELVSWAWAAVAGLRQSLHASSEEVGLGGGDDPNHGGSDTRDGLPSFLHALPRVGPALSERTGSGELCFVYHHDVHSREARTRAGSCLAQLVDRLLQSPRTLTVRFGRVGSLPRVPSADRELLMFRYRDDFDSYCYGSCSTPVQICEQGE